MDGTWAHVIYGGENRQVWVPERKFTQLEPQHQVFFPRGSAYTLVVAIPDGLDLLVLGWMEMPGLG